MRTLVNEYRAEESPQFICPKCGSKYFGTVNALADPLEYRCHDQFGRGCKKVGNKEEMFAIVKNVIRERDAGGIRASNGIMSLSR